MKIFISIALIFSIYHLQAQNTPKPYTTKVEGACGMCKDRIEGISLNTIGVNTAVWNEETKILEITIDAAMFNETELHQKLSNAGHETSKMKANEEAYHALPACCAYKTEGHEHHEEDNPLIANSINEVAGVIYELGEKNKKTAIIGANIYWLGGTAGTVSRSNGSFNIPMQASSNMLIVEYLGYNTDTLIVDKPGTIEIVLKESEIDLKGVQIVGRKKSMSISYISPIKLRKISQKELTKAACCNLSESFETNPAVDVSYTDAVTGTKQIEMLGLAGPYVQITRENMPDVRGLASIYGLEFIPGPWVESIQLNLGTGSVVNGFESIAGQINVELKKPSDDERLFVNGYYGSGGRIEANVIASTPISDRFDTNVLLHGNVRAQAHDNNFDGFLDMPKGGGFSLANNWKYYGDNGNEGNFGFKVTSTDNTSGQDNSHHEGIHPPGYVLWKANIQSNRYEAWLKRGKAFLDKPNTSIGFQLGGILYDQKSNFGARTYNGDQKMLYANLIYQTTIKNKDNKITMGTSFQAENTEEQLGTQNYIRNEYVPGIFGEYTYSKNEKIDIVLGLRADYHNNFGLFVTPRLHTRYALSQWTVLRGSIGRGQRTANIIAENIGALASSRSFIIENEETKTPYGLQAEVAWNYGLNLMHDFNDKMQFNLDLYLTNFQNQVVVDYDQNTSQLWFYNLDGKSYSRSIQTQLDYTLLRGLDIRLAYRYNDVKVQYKSGLLAKPLVSPHRAFCNLAYEVKGWRFDYTINWQSPKRIANTLSNPEEYRLDTRSKSFSVSNAQITKSFPQAFEFYIGGENIFNFQQSNPIISGGEPYGQYFDASQVWGPVFGSMYYIGFRYSLMNKNLD
ncbi:MAG: hypothetical protein RLZZ546_68 [Bacteroidota bacterium]